MVQGRHVLDVMSVVLLIGGRAVGGRFSSLVVVMDELLELVQKWYAIDGKHHIYLNTD